LNLQMNKRVFMNLIWKFIKNLQLFSFMILLVDKPKGMTSHDVVGIVRKVTGERRVGHGGTLDPNATGLLIVGVGRESTKKLAEIAQHTKKTYEAEIFLGETRDTDDVEGKVLSSLSLSLSERPNRNEVDKLLDSFLGEQMQMPPAFSAIKLKGKKAYELARKGQEVILKPRTIIVYTIERLEYEYPILKIVTEVSSGTYIRALARDIGEKLGCGAYLKELRRTKIGTYDIKDAMTIEMLREKGENFWGKE
jgi:tRNA pseudouridine55 synthase